MSENLKKLLKKDLVEMAKANDLPVEVGGKELTKAELIELLESKLANEEETSESVEVQPAVEPEIELEAEPVETGEDGTTQWTIARARKLSVQLNESRAAYKDMQTKYSNRIKELEAELKEVRKKLRKFVLEANK